MNKPKVLEINGQEVASIFILGDLKAIDVDGYSRMSSEEARKLAAYLIQAAEYLDASESEG